LEKEKNVRLLTSFAVLWLHDVGIMRTYDDGRVFPMNVHIISILILMHKITWDIDRWTDQETSWIACR
jgi:hypothetical protein